jgi:ABC-type uncharacterized transport system auxiliary subunit
MKFIKKSILLSLLPLIFLGGCFNEKKEETFKTVEYYVKNKEARDARKKECLEMRDTTETVSKDCANVDIAIRKTRSVSELVDKSSWFK